ncbi:MAG: T9SS type A sorting domain-containing protein [Fibrobacteraceae bacterium]|nr:T9SS type A sorting domain-containing protein [Fibrobacteraceae bacterium]
MFRLLFSVVFLLLNTVAFAAFDECRFNYGRQWQNSFNENTDFSGKGLSHLAIWIGDNDNYNQYWEGSMVRAAKKNNLTPVFYAYVIAEYDKDQGNQDCDVGSPNHCTNGAETIRNKWSNIISRYRSYAQGVAQDFGTSGTTIWLIEPDFFQYSVSGDNHDTRFNQVGGGIPDADLCGKYFNDIVSTIKSALPNAKIAVDISPWLNDGLVTWYANFDKSKVDYLFSSGGRTQGDQERMRSDNNNLVTWAFASSAMGGKKIIADDGYGVGGASNNDYGDWLNVSNLNNRISDGVIGLTIQEPNDSYYTFAASNPLNMCSGGVSSSSVSVTPSSSSQAVVAATKKTLLVDDLEDGDTVSLWGGDWAIYNDNDNGGASTVKRAFVTGNASSKAIQVSYTLNVGSLTYDPFIGLVVTTNADGITTENLSTCSSIQYDYKGAAHSFRVESPNITDAAYFETSVASTNSWTTKTVSWNSLAQPTWGISKSLSSTRETVRAFSWQIQAASGSGTLEIDNVKCLGLAEGSSSSSAVSSSSSVQSSSSITSSSSIQSSSSVVSSSSLVSSSSEVSSSSALSSSSVAVSSEWQSNTKLTVNENTVVIGQSNNYNDERHVTKNLGNLVTGETYKLSFDATESAGGQEFEITTTLNEYCNEKTTLTGGSTTTVTCTFTAKSNDEAILTLDMPSSRWEEITISNFSFGVVSALQTFTITFVNGTEVLQQETLEEGSLPSYKGEKPVKESTEKYIYNFKGWSPEIIAVAGNATYKAVFDSALVRYYVQFLNGENVLQADSLGYGILPTYNATTPTKAATQAYTYSFKGWSPEIAVVAGNATYKAVFDSVLNKFTVTFVDEDGAILKAATAYDYGTSAENIVLPANPTKPSTDSQTFTFAGWTPALSAVTENVVYKATYSSTTNAYTITFVNGSETLQSSAVAFGETPAYSGEVPTKAATQAYTYTFKGWSPEIIAVAGNATYKAVFDSALVRYYVQFLNGENVLQADSLGYGILPTYNATTPTKAATQAYTYTFKGWSPEIIAVAGNATYKAVFDSTLIPESSSSIESSSSSEAVVPAIVTECSIDDNQLNVSITPASDGSSWNLQFNVFDALGNVIRSSEKISGTASSYTFLVPSIAPTATTQTYYAYIYLNDKAEQACPSTLSWNVASVVVPSSSSETPVVSSSSSVDEPVSSSSVEESSSSEISSSSMDSSSSEVEIQSSSSEIPVVSSSSSIDEPVSSSSVEESSSSEISSSSMDSSSSETEIQSSSSEIPVVSSSSSVDEPVSSSSVEESSSSEISSSSMDSSSSETEIQSSSSEITDGLENALIPSLALSLDGRKLQIHGAKDVQVRLFDLQGVPRYTVNNVNGFVDLNNLPAGSYIVYVKAKDFSLSRRLVLR